MTQKKQIKLVWQKINHQQEMFIGNNFIFHGRQDNWEYYRNEPDNSIYYLSKNKDEKFIIAIAVRKQSLDNKSITMELTAFYDPDKPRVITEQEPVKLLERIMRHHPHRDIYEREMKLRSKDILEKELKAKDTVKPKRMEI